MAPSHRSGFTLIELLIVLVIMAVAIGGVLLSLPNNKADLLNQDAQRLVAIMEAARSQSQASGAPVKLSITKSGYVLHGIVIGGPIASAYYWKTPRLVAGLLKKDASSITLGPDDIIGAQGISLALPTDGGMELYVATNGLAPFEVYRIKPF
jgi:general secretion pathway protein H